MKKQYDIDSELEPNFEKLDEYRQDMYFEALYQGFVHHCNFRDPVEELVEDHLAYFAIGYRILAGHLYESLVRRGSHRDAIKRHLQKGVKLPDETVLHLRQRGVVTSDGEVNPFLIPYLDFWHDFLDSLKSESK